MSVKLQVALDLMNLKRAIKIAKEAVEGGGDIIEAGTPLIKSEGMEAVRKLKAEFPNNEIVADMKTMDVGGLEVKIAAKAGADIVVVLAASDDETLKEAVRAARNYDTKITADMLGVSNPAERTKEVCKLGVDYVGVHVGIDSQMKGENPLRVLSKIIENSSVPVAVAGGINSENAASIVKKGVEIIIVGGSIIKAKNVRKSAENIKRAIDQGISMDSEVSKKFGPHEIRKCLTKVSTPNVSDAMHRCPCMKGIHQLTAHGEKIIGKAFTVKTVDGDWAKPVEAIERADEGDIIVVDSNGGETAVWGELASLSAKIRDISGIVIDGAVRDIDDIEKIDFPVFARHIASNAGEPKGYGGVKVDIVCGGVRIRQGDWIIGDASGVMVIPKEEALMIANRSLDVMEKENRIREEIKEGKTLSVVMELQKWEKVQ
ncbi:MAG: 3-hexulose-6-phosphate synthase [Thermoplasmata archaeon]